MASSPQRILIDLSFGSVTHSGIGTDLRSFVRIASNISSLELSGLFYSKVSKGYSLSHSKSLSKRAVGLLPTSRRQIFGAFLKRSHRGAELNQELFGGYIRDVYMNGVEFPNLKIFITDLSENHREVYSNYRLLAPRVRLRGEFDYFLTQNLFIPVFRNATTVYRVHDLIPLITPLFGPRNVSSSHGKGILAAIQHIKRHGGIIVANSKTTQQQILDLELAKPDDVHCIPVSIRVRPYRSHEKISTTRQAILAVGSLDSRKNWSTLFSSIKRLRSSGVSRKPILTFVGKGGWDSSENEKALEGLVSAGLATWYKQVSEAQLDLLYSSAKILVAPSLSEGFDIPAVEASICGKVVIASDTKVHRELLHPKSLFFDPYSVQDLKSKIEIGLDSSNFLSLPESTKFQDRYSDETISKSWEALLCR